MDFPITMETIRQSCRVCLQKGDINIWDFKVKICSDETTDTNSLCMGVSADESTLCSNEDQCVNTLELMEIFNNEADVLQLVDEFPLLCGQCLEDFRLCYIFFQKVKSSNLQLRKIYDDCRNKCTKEEYLIDTPEDISANLTNAHDYDPALLGLEDIEIIPQTNPAELSHSIKYREPRTLHHRILDKNSSIVVTQYVPAPMEPSPDLIALKTEEDDEDFRPPRNLLTVDCKTVEVQDVNQLEILESAPNIVLECENSFAAPPVFVCQYCPQAFAKSEFLKTHIQRNHMCKFCMQTFRLYSDLCQHLRQHTEHKCVICQKMLSSQTNLRHHIKRIHHINLPPKMTLLDFIQSREQVEDVDAIIDDVLPHELANESVDMSDDYGESEYVEESLDDIIYYSKADDVEELMDGDDIEII